MERQPNPPCFSDLREALLNEGHAYLFRYNKSLRCQGSSDSKAPKVAVILKNAVSLPQSKRSCLPGPAYLAKLTSLHLVCSSSTLVRVAFQVGWLTHLSPFFHEHPRKPISPWHPEHLLFPLPRVLGTHLVPPLGLCTCELLSLEWCFFISSHSSALTFFKLCSNITLPLLIYFRIVFSAITCCHLIFCYLKLCLVYVCSWFQQALWIQGLSKFISVFMASRREFWA